PGFGTGTGYQSEMIALQQPVETLTHVELQRPQPRFQTLAAQDRWCPPGTRGVLLPCLHRLPVAYLAGAAAGACWPGAPCGRAETCGSGTVCSTRLVM